MTNCKCISCQYERLLLEHPDSIDLNRIAGVYKHDR